MGGGEKGCEVWGHLPHVLRRHGVCEAGAQQPRRLSLSQRVRSSPGPPHGECLPKAPLIASLRSTLFLKINFFELFNF